MSRTHRRQEREKRTAIRDEAMRLAVLEQLDIRTCKRVNEQILRTVEEELREWDERNTCECWAEPNWPCRCLKLWLLSRVPAPFVL